MFVAYENKLKKYNGNFDEDVTLDNKSSHTFEVTMQILRRQSPLRRITERKLK